MKTRLVLLTLLLSSAVYGAPGDYPLTINSRAASAPQVQVYRASPRAFALTFVDGATASDITGHTVWMSWSTNAYASTVSTAACAIVSGTGGTARAVFIGQTFNYAPGRYIYEVGVATAGVPQTVRQGVLVIEGSPYAAGGSITTWTTNLYFAQYQFMDVYSHGPYRFSGSTHTTNADGSITVSITGGVTFTEQDLIALAQIGVASNALNTRKVDRADTNGWTITTHTGLATGTPLYVEADATALGAVGTASNALRSAITTETGRATIAEAALVPRSETNNLVAGLARAVDTLAVSQRVDGVVGWTNGAEIGSHAALYPRSNPSNWITSASVPSGTNYATAAQGAKADAAYPASNPSNFVDRAAATNGMQPAGDYYLSSNPSNYYRASNPSNFVDRAAATSGMQEAGNYFVVGTNSGVTVVSNVVGSQWIKLGLNGGDGYSPSITLRESDNDNEVQLAATAAGYLSRNNQVMWDTGNDGAGSGLDADTVDGQHGPLYPAANPSNFLTTVPGAAIIRVDKSGNDSTGVRGDWSKPFLTLAAVEPIQQPGDAIVLGVGTWTFSATEALDLSNHVALIGCGPSVSRIYATATAGVETAWAVQIGTSNRIESLTVECDTSTTQNRYPFRTGTDCTMLDVTGIGQEDVLGIPAGVCEYRSCDFSSGGDVVKTDLGHFRFVNTRLHSIARTTGSHSVGIDFGNGGTCEVVNCDIDMTTTNPTTIGLWISNSGVMNVRGGRIRGKTYAIKQTAGTLAVDAAADYDTSDGEITKLYPSDILTNAAAFAPAGCTNGLASTGYVAVAVAPLVSTNDAAYLNLTTNTATKAQGAKADTALQSEADTLATVLARGTTAGGASLTNAATYAFTNGLNMWQSVYAGTNAVRFSLGTNNYYILLTP